MLNKKGLSFFLSTWLLFFATVAKAQFQDTATIVEPPAAEVDTIGVADESKDTYEIKYSKADFDSISTTNIETISQRKNADSVVTRLKKDDDFWYIDVIEKKEKPVNNNSFWQSFFNLLDSKNFRVISWIVLALLMIVAIIVYLRNNNIGLFSSSSKKITEPITHVDGMPENIFEMDYEKAISTALQNNNYRLATRFLFLRSLKTLSIKKIITYSADKTNFDYVFEVNGSPYYNNFVMLSRNYEYVWYGNFNLNDQQFKLIQDLFNQFQQQLVA